MFIPTIKSNAQRHSAAVQPFSSKMFSAEKRITKKIYSFLTIVTALVLLSSCQKESLSDPALNGINADDLSASAAGGTGPKVDAGSARRIVYPDDASTTLNGSGSSSIGSVSFQWKQVLGNSTALIEQPTRASTSVSKLKPGLYKFVLRATDNNGNSSTDTTTVSVLEKMTWTVEGVKREALVHPPTGGSGAAPLMFAFHGHTGKALGFAERGFEVSWPEAIVVYPQGLPTKANNDKQGKSSGWQRSVGEVNNHTGVKDQDVKFFDAMLNTLKNKYRVNSNQVFTHGWSNGGNLVYDVLWEMRADKIAAIAPAGATLGTTKGKKPLPVMHIAGTHDEFYAFSKQQQTVQQVRELNKCSSNGTKWASGPGGLSGTRYASPIDAPVVFLQYDGGHAYPFSVPPYITRFFKEVSR